MRTERERRRRRSREGREGVRRREEGGGGRGRREQKGEEERRRRRRRAGGEAGSGLERQSVFICMCFMSQSGDDRRFVAFGGSSGTLTDSLR